MTEVDDTQFDAFKQEFKTLLEAQSAANRALEDARNSREVLRNQKADEFQGEMRGAMKTLQGKVAEHDALFKTQEAEFEVKISAAMQSMGSVEEKVTAAVTLLEGQNKATEEAQKRAALEKEEERKNNSIAVRHKNDSIRAKTPIWLAAISFFGLLITDVTNCQNNRVSSQATTSKIGLLTERVESIATLAASAPPPAPTYVLPQTEIAATPSAKPPPAHHTATPQTHMAASPPAAPAAAPAAASPQ